LKEGLVSVDPPPGYHTIVPRMVVGDAAAAVDFLIARPRCGSVTLLSW
jgi:hypothetical protein